MKTKPLWQVSVRVSSEAEEATTQWFEEFFHQYPSVYTDMETGEITVSVHLEKGTGMSRIKENPVLKNITVKKLPPENWAESWKRHFKPIEIGKKLLIKPSWDKRRARKGEHIVILDPGLSFGTGQHATTFFCLQQLTAYRQEKTRQSFLDIGSGSGILAICAAKIGYHPVQAFDFDPQAVRISRENAARNKVSVKPQCKDLTKLPLRCARKYDLICANLIYDLLISEAKKITHRLKPTGHLILAGILISQFPKVQAAYEKLGLRLVNSREEKEWKSGEFQFCNYCQSKIK